MADRREITAELLQRFTYAEGWRDQYDRRAIENYRLYVGYRDALPEELRGRSNLHIPKTYEIVDSLRARYLRAMFVSNPVIEYIPDPLLYYQEGISPDEYLQMLTAAEDSAKYATYLVDTQLRNSHVFAKFYDYVTAFLVFPAAVMALGWRHEKKTVRQRGTTWDPQYGMQVPGVEEREVVTCDDNDLQFVDYFDFWIDPRATSLDNARFCFQRDWLTEKELKAKLEVLQNAGAGKVYKPDDWEALAGAGAALQEGRADRLAEVGLATEAGQGYWPEIRKGYLFELLHYWQDDRHAILVNRKEVVYDGDNPYWHGKKPFITASFDPRPGEFYGFSAVELIEHLQHELNTNRNQRIDNVSMVLNKMWWVDRSAEIDEKELVSRPHGIIHSDRRDEIDIIETGDITSSSYNEEQLIKEDIDNTVGAPAIVRGVDPERKTTATETVTKSEAADLKFQVRVMLYEEFMSQLAVMLDMNNQQFVTNPRLFRIEEEWQVVTPEELRGHHAYRPASSNMDVMVNRDVRRQQVLELMQTVQGNPLIDPHELLKLVLEAYGIRGTEKLLLPQEQAPMQEQAPEQVPGGGVAPEMAEMVLNKM